MKNKHFAVLAGTILAVFLVIIGAGLSAYFLNASQVLQKIRYWRITAAPPSFKNGSRENGFYYSCRAMLSMNFSGASIENQSERAIYLGMLPQERAIAIDMTVDGCIRRNLAIYWNEKEADQAVTTIVETNSGSKQWKNIKLMQVDDDITHFKGDMNITRADIYGSVVQETDAEYNLLLIKRCNAVASVAIIRSLDGETTSGAVLSDESLIKYAHTIDNRMKSAFCSDESKNE